MKIECNHCGAGYSVADEKVAGRRLKLRCKKCSEPIRVDGTTLAAESTDAAVPQEAGQDVAQDVAQDVVMNTMPPPAPDCPCGC